MKGVKTENNIIDHDYFCQFQVLKLIQLIAQARQTAKRISDHSTEMAASNSFLSWFGVGSSEHNNTFTGGEMDDLGEGVKKTHEFLDKALDYLCQIFRVSLELLLFRMYVISYRSKVWDRLKLKKCFKLTKAQIIWSKMQ